MDHRCGQPTHIYHKATETFPESMTWRPSIFMPRWASRILLEIELVRAQRVSEISEDDAKAEGVRSHEYDTGLGRGGKPGFPGAEKNTYYGSARGAFASLWDSINARRGFGWKANPWVWVIDFRRLA